MFLSQVSVVSAQVYHNQVNTRFSTISTGPMQATIIDLPAGASRSVPTNVVAQRMSQIFQSRQAALSRQMTFLKNSLRTGRTITPGVPDIVMLRQNGKLILPSTVKRGTGANDITFTFPAAGTTGAWPTATQQNLQTLVNAIYPQLKLVYGNPSWSGTVTIVDGDNLNPTIDDRDAFSGGIYNISTNQIIFAEYNTLQSAVLNLTQMMAIAFHGPDSISYDAWEKGMARAATMMVVQNLINLGQLSSNPSDTNYVDVADPLWHALNYYDLLNQPALGNDRFYPVSLQNTPLGTTGLGGMLYPRLQMSGSAWLKVATTDPNFFKNFNAAYYTAWTATPSIANNIPQLKQLASQVLTSDGASTIEGQSFSDWYQQQYVLDTSISPGTKEYLWSVPSRPTTSDNYSIAVVIVYQSTSLDSSGNSVETPLAGTSYPIYWDNTFTNRLYLGAQYESVTISAGEGTDSPVFPNTLGGTDPNGVMRVTMDFPINSNDARLYVGPRTMGTTGSPNNFWGVVVGADTGTMQIQTETGVNQTFNVVQGAFGGALPSTAFSRPGRTTLTFTSSTGQKTVRQVVTGYNEFVPVFYVTDPYTSLTYKLPAGPAMVSFPILPNSPKAEDALLDPTTGNPLFNSGNLLMAEWEQNATGTDKYLRYPTMQPLSPGNGYWENFSQPTSVEIIGRSTTQDQAYTMGLQYGWNQVGDPYTTAIQASDLLFQNGSNNVPDSLAQAYTDNWIGQNIPGVGVVALLAYDPSQGYIPATTMEPWQGYWMRVLVSSGLTITYPNPIPGGKVVATTKRATPVSSDGWTLPLRLISSNGLGATVWLGQSSQATSGYNARMDIPMPPPINGSAPSMAFSPTDWGANTGQYLTEIHQINSSSVWNITVVTPTPNANYTLTWSGIIKVPRTTQLVLVDRSTGTRQYLNGSSAYTFNSGSAASRELQIIPELHSFNALHIMNVNAEVTRASNLARINFMISSDAAVTASIMDATGKTIRTLQTGRAVTAGTQSLSWDMKTNNAISVPSGVYLVKIIATSPDGESARVVQPIIITR